MLWLLKFHIFVWLMQMFWNIYSFDHFCFHLIKVQRLLRKHDWCKERKVLGEPFKREWWHLLVDWFHVPNCCEDLQWKASHYFCECFVKFWGVSIHPINFFCFKDDRISRFLETQRVIADLSVYIWILIRRLLFFFTKLRWI